MPLRSTAQTNEVTYANQGDLANTAFSMSCWVYFFADNGTGGNPCYFVHTQNTGGAGGIFGVVLRRQSATGFVGVVEFNKSSTGTSGGHINSVSSAAGAIPLHKWCNVIATCNGGFGAAAMRLIIDGVSVSSTAASADTLALTGVHTLLGRGTATLGTNGMMHKFVSIRGREFTAGEITELQAGRLPATLAASEIYLRADLDANDDGIGANAAAVTGTPTGTIPLTARYPADLPGLAAYYDFRSVANTFEDTPGTNTVEDLDSVAEAFDLSGAGNTISQGTAANQPKWTNSLTSVGRVTLSEAGASDIYSLTGAGTSLWDNRACTLARIGMCALRSTFNNADFNLNQLNANAICQRINGGFLGYRKTNTSTQVSTSGIVANSAPDIVSLACGSDNIIAYRGTHASSNMTAVTAVTAAAGLTIGTRTSATVATSDQGEAWMELVYQRKLDATNIGLLHDWCVTEFGFVEERTRLLWACGSSTAYGTAGTYKRGWTRRLSTGFLNTSVILNHGSGGNTLTDLLTTMPDIWDTVDFTNPADQGLASSAKTHALLLVNFANDFALLGAEATEAEITARLIAQYDELAAYIRSSSQGTKIIAVIPWKGDAQNTYTDAYAAYVAHMNGTADWDQLIDLDPVITDPTYRDGTHANDAGMQLLADLIEAAVLEAEAGMSVGGTRARAFRSRAFR